MIQAVLNGIMAGAILAVPAIGLTTIFAVLRYPTFAIAAYATIGAFAGWYANTFVAGGLVSAVIAAGLMSALIGLIAEHGILSRLRPSGALTVAIASLGVNLFLENAVRFIFGNDLRSFDMPIERDIVFARLRVGPQQATNALLACAVMAAVFALLKLTSLGRAIRAVADNSDLARLRGIDPDRIAMLTIVVSTGLVGVGGVLLGLDTSIDSLSGRRILLPVFAASVLGGLGSIPGAVVGALALGVAEELSVLVVPSTYKTAIGFFVILAILTFRPRGLLGERAA